MTDVTAEAALGLPPLLRLDDPRASTVEAVGGKAARLSRLATRYRVPPGFCLTTAAWEWQKTAGGMTAELRMLIEAAHAELARVTGQAEPIVAARSSAVDEDGAGSSLAGQLETFLNVTGLDELLRAIAGCWDSAASERVATYRREQGLPSEAVPVGVLVQQLVDADVAAVAFSANPVTGNRDEVVINASYGLGESIVSGTVTPDTYTVRRSDLTITDLRLGEKQVMTIRAPGGTREVPVPRLLRAQRALDDTHLAEIARLAIDLEAATGAPVDVECAYRGGDLYLLQCRPITTLR